MSQLFSSKTWPWKKPAGSRKLKISNTDLAIEIFSWVGAAITLFLLVKYVMLLF